MKLSYDALVLNLTTMKSMVITQATGTADDTSYRGLTEWAKVCLRQGLVILVTHLL